MHSRTPDAPEFEQGKIRLLNSIATFPYFAVAFLWDGTLEAHESTSLALVGTYYGLGAALLAWMALRPGVNHARRWAGVALDVGGITLMMSRTGEIGAVMYGLYLWVTMGNGFRFGRRYLYGAQVTAIGGFATVLLVSDYWHQLPFVGAALMLALIALPAYVSMLLSRLQEARAAADAANVAKTKFLAAASHDLRQPMQALSLYTSVLQACREAPPQPVVRGIELSVETLTHLFDSLLDISKLESGVIKPSVSVFPLLPLIEHVVTAEMPLAAQKDLELRVAGTSAAVRSDPALLERMLKNLVINAIRYTERGGIVVGCRRRGTERLRLEVVDSGIGIALEEQERIFDEYYQISGKSVQGLGLGLPIVKSLGALLGHAVAVRSSPGRGSVFSIELERASPAAAAAEVSIAPPDSLHGRVVVIVDDDAEIRDSMRLLLDRWGCRVVSGATLTEVASRLQAARLSPDALIVDYRLAGAMDGVQVIERLRGTFGAELPALIVTGSATLPSLDGCAADIPIAMKPVSPGRLRAFLSAGMPPQG
jgi:signal transduction histidine kinase/CheY-like chemotaxis protein